MPLALYNSIHIQIGYNEHIRIYAVKFNTHTHIHTGSHFSADTVLLLISFIHTFTLVQEFVNGPSRL